MDAKPKRRRFWLFLCLAALACAISPKGAWAAQNWRMGVATTDSVAASNVVLRAIRTDLSALTDTTTNTNTLLKILADWDATHDSAVPADGAMILGEAKEYDDAIFPNAVAEGDAARIAVSKEGTVYVMIVGEDGSWTPLDQSNEAIRTIIGNSEAQQRYTNTLIDGTVFDDDPTTETSAAVNIAGFSTIVLLCEVDSTAAPTSLDIWAEFSFDNSTWFGENVAASGVPLIDSQNNWNGRYQFTGDKEVALMLAAKSFWFRVTATATGTDATNKYTVTVEEAHFGR
jgi:hypothetical protein